MMNSGGCLVHPLKPASASDAPISCRKFLRETPSFQTEACRGNSRCSMSRKPSLSASSSRLRQYCLPSNFSSLARTCFRSSGSEFAAGFFFNSSWQFPLIFLPMARRAARQIRLRPQVILLHQQLAHLVLVGEHAIAVAQLHHHRSVLAGRLVIHAEDVVRLLYA